jgi:hypothetical protein
MTQLNKKQVNIKQVNKPIRLKSILAILALTSLTSQINFISAKPAKPARLQLVYIPETLRFFDNAECARFVLTCAKIPAAEQAADLSALITQVEALPYHKTVTALVTAVTHIIDDHPGLADNQLCKDLGAVPWMGHLERIIFILKHTRLPIEPSAVTAVLNFAEKYRGIVNSSILTYDKKKTPDQQTEFYRELEALQVHMPKIIQGLLNFAPECGATCNQATMDKVKQVLAENRDCHDLTIILDKLKNDLPNLIQDPDLLAQFKHFQAIIGPVNKTTGEPVNMNAIRIRIAQLTDTHNRHFIKRNGFTVRD